MSKQKKATGWMRVLIIYGINVNTVCTGKHVDEKFSACTELHFEMKKVIRLEAWKNKLDGRSGR